MSNASPAAASSLPPPPPGTSWTPNFHFWSPAQNQFQHRRSEEVAGDEVPVSEPVSSQGFVIAEIMGQGMSSTYHVGGKELRV